MKKSLLVLLLALLLSVGCRGADKTTSVIPTLPQTPNSTQNLLVLPDDGRKAVLALFEQAQSSIRFKIYLLSDHTTREALIAAAQRGVDVRVLIEREPTGGSESNQTSFDMLRNGGVEVRWAPNIFRMTHEKSVVIDNHTALIGTFNYTGSSFTRNREYGLIINESQVVNDVAAIFDADWSGKNIRLGADSPLVLSPDNSRQRLLDLIDNAHTSLWLEEATLLDEEITTHLSNAAQKGIIVRFIGPERKNEQDRATPYYEKLRQAGGEVALLADPLVHAKVIVADGQKALLGSINLSFSSLNLNRELGIITSDAAVLARLQDTLNRDWKQAQKTAAAPKGVISWQEAGNYVGSEVVVEGEIVRSYDSGKVTFLNFSEDYRNTLTLVIFASGYDRYPQAPAQYFLQQRVRVRGRIKLYKGAPEIIIDSPGQIEIVGKTSSRTTPGAANAPPSSSQSLPAVISWREAGSYVGQEVTVEGQIVRTYDTGKVTFANFREDWKDSLSLVIFASDYAKFPQAPAQLLLHRYVRVQGRVKEYRSAPEIVIESPAQITLLTAPATELTPTAVPTPAGIIAWDQTGHYIGQTITVAGLIVSTYDTGNITFLDFTSDHDAFVAVIFAEDYNQFPCLPAKLYEGKQVWITGKITTYKGKPEIIIHSPEQVEIFD